MKKTKKGFTLVELVIVVAVMAVLVAVAIPTVGAITDSAKQSVAKSNAQTIESMIKLEEAEISDQKTNNTLTDQIIANALNKAKLGISDGKFIYDTTTGICSVADADATAAGTDQYIIIYETSSDTTTISVGFEDETAVNPSVEDEDEDEESPTV